MPKPEFITFTGADEQTSIEGMRRLSKKYPIEWALLVSPKLQGAGRYPSLQFLQDARKTAPSPRMALHVCGAYARAINDGKGCPQVEALIDGFQRIQVNHGNPVLATCAEFAGINGIDLIFQCRNNEFPEQDPFWLYDRSGGTGAFPRYWPKLTGDRLAGYAGGLNAGNARQVCDGLEGEGRFWIDMESGVRDENDNFRLDWCEMVCQSIFD